MSDPRVEIVPLLPHLRAFARNLTRSEPHLADDLVQDTMVLALHAWERFTPGTNLKAWLFTILRNHFCNIIGRRKFEMLSDDVEHHCSVPATQDNGLAQTDFKRAFSRLSPMHREVLVLVGVHGMHYEDVAAITGCAPGTVKSRVFRARKLLRKMLLGDMAGSVWSS